MTQTAVAYTRGALSPVTKRRPAGPGKARAGAVRPDLAAQARVAAHQARADFTIEVWRSDDETVRDVSVDRLLGLQQALFLLRAGVVDALYVHDRNDVAAADLATVAAEVKACGRSLIVAGQRISSPHELCLAPELGELAEVGVRLRDTVTPRLNCRDRWHADEDLDIGSMDIKSDAARLAHKLRVEFSLPLNQVASLLDAASYCFRGVPLSWRKQTVDRLLRGAGEYISEEPLDDAWGVGRSADLFGDSRLRFIYAQHGWNGPSEGCHVLLDSPQLSGQLAGAPGLDAADRPALVRAVGLVRAGIVHTLVIPDSRVCGSVAIRELLLAEAWAAGVRTDVDGSGLGPADPCQPGVEQVRSAAGVAVRLHRALRVHDRATIHVLWKERVETALMEAADRHPHRRLSTRELADVLNRKVIPTRSGRGAWSHSQVRECRRPEQSGYDT